jgi:hypothetical protein
MPEAAPVINATLPFSIPMVLNSSEVMDGVKWSVRVALKPVKSRPAQALPGG